MLAINPDFIMCIRDFGDGMLSTLTDGTVAKESIKIPHWFLPLVCTNDTDTLVNPDHVIRIEPDFISCQTRVVLSTREILYVRGECETVRVSFTNHWRRKHEVVEYADKNHKHSKRTE